MFLDLKAWASIHLAIISYQSNGTLSSQTQRNSLSRLLDLTGHSPTREHVPPPDHRPPRSPSDVWPCLWRKASYHTPDRVSRLAWILVPGAVLRAARFLSRHHHPTSALRCRAMFAFENSPLHFSRLLFSLPVGGGGGSSTDLLVDYHGVSDLNFIPQPPHFNSRLAFAASCTLLMWMARPPLLLHIFPQPSHLHFSRLPLPNLGFSPRGRFYFRFLFLSPIPPHVAFSSSPCYSTAPYLLPILLL